MMIEIDEKQDSENIKVTENKNATSGMPVYETGEFWVQQYIEDFGTEPSFF